MAEESSNVVEEPEASSVTVKDDCSEVGGYDCDFVESPADDLLCKICHYPARDPVLAVCCGHNFCSYCLEHYKQSKVIDHSSCPYCRKEKFQTVPDKKTGRQVLNLKVFCPHKCHGCEWVGELRSMENHINKNSNDDTGCPFTELQCSNGCGVVMQRRLVEGHLKLECELREMKCKYCNTTGSYQWINSSHQEECPKYPVECPNHCEAGHVRKQVISRLDAKELELENVKKDLLDTKEKLKESQEIQSQLKTAIDEKGRELDDVRKNAEENHKALQGVVRQLKETEELLQHQLKINTQLQLQIDTIFSYTWPLQLNHLANSNNKVVTVVIKLAEFEKYGFNEIFNSTEFYTCDRGYKMQLSTYPRGMLNTTDHVAVCIYLMKGEHDDHLTWQVKGILTVQLLNQLSDSNHSEPVPFHFDGSSLQCQRVTKGLKAIWGEWCNHFIPHRRLSYDADKKCQYLKDDCVFFRVCSFHAAVI